MTISIRVECTDIQISGKNKTFLQLAERAVKLTFTPGEDGKTVIMEYVFPNIWAKKS